MSAQSVGTLSGSEGRLAWRAWKPDARARALLVLVHGYAEHMGRYEHVAAYCTGRGYAFYGFDQAGHGLSEGTRGDVKYFGVYLTDLQRFIQLAQEREPGLPTFLISHSMGGLIALAYGERQPRELQGIVASAPGLQMAMPVPAWKLAIGRAMAGIMPTLALANGIPAEYLTHDPTIAGAYARRDPLVFKTATARWANEFFRTQTETMAAAARFSLPCLLMHGGDDHLISPEGTREFYATVSSTDKTLKIYDGFYHEIFNEIGKEKVFDDIGAWLDKRAGA